MLARQSAQVAAANFAAQLVVSVLYALSARGVSPGEFGRVVSAVVVANYLAAVIDFGSNSLWTRELAKDAISTDVVGGRLRSKIAIGLIVAFSFVLIGSVALNDQYVWITGSLSVALILSQGYQVPLRAARLAHRVSHAVVVDRIVATASWFVLSVLSPSALNLGVALIIGSLSGATYCYGVTPKIFRMRVVRSKCLSPWTSARSYGVGSVAIGAQALDQPLLSLAAGPVAGGLYGAVSRWTQPMGVVATAYAQVGVAHVANMSSFRAAVHHLRRSSWVLGLAVLGCVIVALGSPWFVDLILGADYRGSAVLLSIIAVATIPAIINQPLYIFLQALGNDKGCARILMLGVAVQLCLCYALSSQWGPSGAAVALGLAQCLILVSLVLLGSGRFRQQGRKVK